MLLPVSICVGIFIPFQLFHPKLAQTRSEHPILVHVFTSLHINRVLQHSRVISNGGGALSHSACSSRSVMIDSGLVLGGVPRQQGTPTQSHISPSILVYEDKRTVPSLFLLEEGLMFLPRQDEVRMRASKSITMKRELVRIFYCNAVAALNDRLRVGWDHTLAGPFWEGCRESRRCSRDA